VAWASVRECSPSARVYRREASEPIQKRGLFLFVLGFIAGVFLWVGGFVLLGWVDEPWFFGPVWLLLLPVLPVVFGVLATRLDMGTEAR
jgi:hypothetical protein